MHDALDDYSHIIDSIDNVIDDALKHQAELKVGFLGSVGRAINVGGSGEDPRKFAQGYGALRFALKQAIETTSDSLDLAKQDLESVPPM